MTVAPIDFKRFTLAKETSFKTPGAYTAPRGYKKEGTLNHGRTVIAIDNALNSFGDRYAPAPNMQSFDCSVSFILNSATFSNFTDVLTAALGSLEADTTLTFSASITNVGVTISGGGPSSIIQVTGDDLKKYLVMVSTVAGGVTLTYWPSLPAGVLTTAVVNLSGTPTGGCFSYLLGGSATTFSMEFDWSALPTSTTQNNVLASGCAIKSCQLIWARDKLLELKLEFIGASYTEDAGASANNTDPTVFTNAMLGWTGDWFLSSGTPVWGAAALGTDQVRAKAVTIEMAPPLIVETGAIGLDGGSTASSVLAGSDITGYTRDAIGTQQVTIRVPYLLAYETAFLAKTAFGLFGVMYSGVPGGAAISAHKIALGIRRLVQSAKPKIVEDGGGRYHDLTFQIERDLTANTNVERIVLGFVTA